MSLSGILIEPSPSGCTLTAGEVSPSCLHREACTNARHRIARLGFNVFTESWPERLPCELDGEFLLVGVCILPMKFVRSSATRHLALYLNIGARKRPFPVVLPHPWTSCLFLASKAVVIPLNLEGRPVVDDGALVGRWLTNGNRVPMLPSLTAADAPLEGHLSQIAATILSSMSGDKQKQAKTARLHAASSRIRNRKVHQRNRDRDAARQQKLDDEEEEEDEEVEDEDGDEDDDGADDDEADEDEADADDDEADEDDDVDDEEDEEVEVAPRPSNKRSKTGR